MYLIRLFFPDVDGKRRVTKSHTAPAASGPNSSIVSQATEDQPMDESVGWQPLSASSSKMAHAGFSGGQAFSSSVMTSYVNMDDTSEVYPMIHRPRGLSIVINNKNFHRKCRMNKRNGTDRDAETLDSVSYSPFPCHTQVISEPMPLLWGDHMHMPR